MSTSTYFCKSCYRYFTSLASDVRCPYCGSGDIEGIEG